MKANMLSLHTPTTPGVRSKGCFFSFLKVVILHIKLNWKKCKHIKQDFSLEAWVPVGWVDLGVGAKAKIKLFQNMVMLHIKLKLTTLAATW